MGSDGAAGAEGTRMRWDRSGRRKLGWTAVAVAIALVGHALLMAGGGHPAEAAHAVPAPVGAAPHGSTAHHSAAASTVGAETTVEHHPTGGGPTGDETAGCGGMLVLARPPATRSSGSVAPPSLATPAAVLPTSSDVGDVVAADPPRPIASPGTRRALLQIYRL